MKEEINENKTEVGRPTRPVLRLNGSLRRAPNPKVKVLKDFYHFEDLQSRYFEERENPKNVFDPELDITEQDLSLKRLELVAEVFGLDPETFAAGVDLVDILPVYVTIRSWLPSVLWSGLADMPKNGDAPTTD